MFWLQVLDKMRTRPIDVFLMKKFNEYCNEQLYFNTLTKQKNFEDFITTNKSFLVALYVKQRRMNKLIIKMEE